MWWLLALALHHPSLHDFLSASDAPAQAVYESYADSFFAGAPANDNHTISHDSQRELVLYPQKSMPNQLPNFTRFASLRKLMITGAATDALRPVCGLSAFIALAARVHADHHAFAARTLFELAPRLGSALALSLSHDSQIELVLYPQKSMRDQLSNVTSFAYLRKSMITGAAADVRRPASGSSVAQTTSVYAPNHHAADVLRPASGSSVAQTTSVYAPNHHALQGDSVPPADSSTATTPSIYQDISAYQPQPA